MATYLLAWNPAKWHWRSVELDVATCRRQGHLNDRWSCGRNKRIQPGDRIYLIRLGQEPRGLIASGWAISDVFEDVHWDEDRDVGSTTARYIDVQFDILLDAEHESIFRREWLDTPVYRKMHWDTQISGITIPEQVAAQLEVDWARFLATKKIVQHHAVERAEHLPDELESDRLYPERAIREVRVTIYERNIEARRQCIRHYGLNCAACGFNFENLYGDIGIGFIHVHHLKPLAEIGAAYEIDPIRDLRPVCPNCHAMLHQRNPPYTIKELKAIMTERTEGSQ